MSGTTSYLCVGSLTPVLDSRQLPGKRKPVWGSSFSRVLFGLAKYAFVLRAEPNAIAAGIQNVPKQRFKVHLSAQHFGRSHLKHRKKLSVTFLVRALSHQFAV